MRYRYLGDRWNAGHAPAGQECDPVKDERGKCVIGATGAALVDFGQGPVVVMRRRLRLLRKERSR